MEIDNMFTGCLKNFSRLVILCISVKSRAYFFHCGSATFKGFVYFLHYSLSIFNVLFLTSQFSDDDDDEAERDKQSADFYEDAIGHLEHKEPNDSISGNLWPVPLCQHDAHSYLKHLTV